MMTSHCERLLEVSSRLRDCGFSWQINILLLLLPERVDWLIYLCIYWLIDWLVESMIDWTGSCERIRGVNDSLPERIDDALRCQLHQLQQHIASVLQHQVHHCFCLSCTNTVSEMTCNVSSGTLNLAHSLALMLSDISGIFFLKQNCWISSVYGANNVV